MYQSTLYKKEHIANESNSTEIYSQYINHLASNIPNTIKDFSHPRKRSSTPTQANSEFLSNREQGDWAEIFLTNAISSALVDFIPIKYGKTDNIVAGEKGFKEFYKSYQDELDKIGKRPDILIFPKDVTQYLPKDISRFDYESFNKIVPDALLGMEIRSSSFLCKKYEEAVNRGEVNGKRKFLGFTLKVEDLHVVLKWISQFNVPHYYAQVFFDSVYVIPFYKMLQIIINPINKNKLFTVERNTKNQLKTTIHININQGLCLGDVDVPPQHSSASRELARGRVLYHVKFEGGNLRVDQGGIREMLSDAARMKNGDFEGL